eukprot:3899709-Rhodomonas_salina.3
MVWAMVAKEMNMLMRLPGTAEAGAAVSVCWCGSKRAVAVGFGSGWVMVWDLRDTIQYDVRSALLADAHMLCSARISTFCRAPCVDGVRSGRRSSACGCLGFELSVRLAWFGPGFASAGLVVFAWLCLTCLRGDCVCSLPQKQRSRWSLEAPTPPRPSSERTTARSR